MFVIAGTSLLTLGVWLVTMVLTTLMVIGLVQAQRLLTSMGTTLTQERIQRDRQITILLLSTIVFFLILVSPEGIVYVFTITGNTDHLIALQQAAFTLETAGCSGNLVLFLLCGGVFRSRAKELVLRCIGLNQ